jgi:6-pyruvoyltetrahydropterin/6-carboxytetrahydropterin synthase
MYRISKTFAWEMGHRITKHKGQCFNVHGHSYRAEVYLESAELNPEGMVADFSELSRVMNPLVDAMDHSFMVFKEDDIMMKFFINVGAEFFANDAIRPFKTFLVPFETTAENIAKYLHGELTKTKLPIHKVVIWETAKCKAEYGY